MILGAQRDIDCWSKKRKTILIRSTIMRFLIRIKIRINPIISFLLINLGPKFPKKINIIVKKAIQLLGLMLLS